MRKGNVQGVRKKVFPDISSSFEIYHLLVISGWEKSSDDNKCVVRSRMERRAVVVESSWLWKHFNYKNPMWQNMASWYCSLQQVRVFEHFHTFEGRDESQWKLIELDIRREQLAMKRAWIQLMMCWRGKKFSFFSVDELSLSWVWPYLTLLNGVFFNCWEAFVFQLPWIRLMSFRLRWFAYKSVHLMSVRLPCQFAYYVCSPNQQRVIANLT